MLSSFSLLAMENNFSQRDVDIYVKDVRDMIDISFLNFNEDAICGFPHLKSLIGFCLSLYKSRFLTPEQAIRNINSIKAYIMQNVPNELRKCVFKEIVNYHWYAYYLIQTLVNKRIEELEKVKGSTIDALYNPVYAHEDVADDDVKEMVYSKAMAKFFVDAGIHNPLDRVPMGLIENMHSVVLYGHTDEICPPSLCMSSDGKYLLSADCNAHEIVWDMEKGISVNSEKTKYDSIKWTSGYWQDSKSYCVIDKTDTYYAVSASLRYPHSSPYVYRIKEINKFPSNMQKNGPAIMLFKRPEDVSYLCQKAFENNKNNTQELLALRESKSINSIEGFPQDNLTKLITEQINQ